MSTLKKYNNKINSTLTIKDNEEPQFPYYTLGNILGKTIKEIADTVQSPIAVAGQSVLTVASLITQVFANVKIDGREYPLSLFGLTISGSGDRKTSTDKIALKPVLDHQSKLMRQFESNQIQYKKQIKAYLQAERNILKNITSNNQNEITNALNALTEISIPINPKIISSEPTLEGLQKGYLNGNSGQGIFNDEAGQFFSGHAMSSDNKIKTITGLSRLWDGSTIERTRSVNKENIYLENRRLSAHFMMQPILAEKIFKDQELTDQGFLARFLIAAPTSLAGTRYYNAYNISKSPIINDYNQLIISLLNSQYQTDNQGGLILKPIEPSKSAKMAWIDIYNDIEKELGQNGKLSKIQPTANKISENILRIAGIIAIIEKSNEINLQQMKRAIELGKYYLNSYLWIINNKHNQPTKERAKILYEWLLTSKNLIDNKKIQLTTILRNSPRAANARNKSNALKLMEVLVENNQLTNLDSQKEWQIKEIA